MKFIVVIVALIAMTSCGSISKNRAYNFDSVRLEMGMNDLEYLGEEEISVEYTKYLGLFKSIERVNGEVYNATHKKEFTLPGTSILKGNTLNMAAYKLVEKFPDATYFQVVFETKEVDKLFLGSVNKQTAKVRAYKIK